MSTDQLDELLALPLEERVHLAEALWQSINPEPALAPSADERDAIQVARRRDAELAAGAVLGIPHEEVMTAVRRAVR